MDTEQTENLSALIFNTNRCGSPQAAFSIISRAVGWTVTIDNWRELTDEQTAKAIVAMEAEFPLRHSPLTE